MRQIIAFYLPQFHPIPENNEWWGEGFTEWTNVGNAKPLFPGHYQPKVPANLGYYDLRVDSVAEKQSDMALEAGIDGFMYWHYWFGNGKTLMSMPYKRMLKNDNIKIKFAFCWANHSWFAKNWNAKGAKKKDRLLLEQLYLGKQDYIDHFNCILPAFMDSRYIKVGNKPIFGLYQPYSLPDIDEFIDLWNSLAQENGFDGIYFISFNSRTNGYEHYVKTKYDMCIVDCVADSKNYGFTFLRKSFYWICRKLNIPQIVNYSTYVDFCLDFFSKNDEITPCIVPNYDHTPRSKNAGYVLHKSTPEKWEKLLTGVKIILDRRQISANSDFIFIKAWNEWAEGNYLEPDLRFGMNYLNIIKNILK